VFEVYNPRFAASDLLHVIIVLYTIYVFRKSCDLGNFVEMYGRTRQVTHGNVMLHRIDALCMPDN
jgi:hypothetical protein